MLGPQMFGHSQCPHAQGTLHVGAPDVRALSVPARTGHPACWGPRCSGTLSARTHRAPCVLGPRMFGHSQCPHAQGTLHVTCTKVMNSGRACAGYEANMPRETGHSECPHAQGTFGRSCFMGLRRLELRPTWPTRLGTLSARAHRAC